jgi:hypothetical protein
MGFWLTEESEELLQGSATYGQAEAAAFLQQLEDEA